MCTTCEVLFHSQADMHCMHGHQSTQVSDSIMSIAKHHVCRPRVNSVALTQDEALSSGPGGCKGPACVMPGASSGLYHMEKMYDVVHAGSCVWMVSSPSYPDYDGYEIYLTENATAMPQPAPSYTVAQQAAINGQNAQFRNFEAALSCVLRRNQQPPATGSWPYVDGWNTTLSIIQ